MTSINAPRLEGNSTLSVEVRIPFKIDFSTDCTKLTMYSPLNDTYTTHTSLNTQILDNPVLTTVNLSALKEAENVVVRLTLSFVLLFLAFCVFFHHNKSYHSSAACQNHSLTLLPYKTSIQQTNQQISGNRELVDVKLPELTTVTNVFQVRDNPSSNGFIVTTTTTTPNLHYHQSTIQYKQNNNRSLSTRTSSASSYLS